MEAVYIAVVVTVLVLGFGQWMLHRKGGTRRDVPGAGSRTLTDNKFPSDQP